MLLQNGHSYFQPNLVAIVVTTATVKVELIPDFYTWAIVLINLIRNSWIFKKKLDS